MYKVALINAIAERTGLTKQQAREALDAMAEIVAESLVLGERVTIEGLGTFSVRVREERIGTNPQTREKMSIPAHRGVGFTASSALRAKLRAETSVEE